MTVVAQAVNDLPTFKRPAGANSTAPPWAVATVLSGMHRTGMACGGRFLLAAARICPAACRAHVAIPVSMAADMGTGPPGEWRLLAAATSRRRDAPCPYDGDFFMGQMPGILTVGAWRAAGDFCSLRRESVPPHVVPMWRPRFDGR